MAGTFISYRRDDAAGYAGRLRESLERRLGEDRVFRDVDALAPGQDFVQAIESRLGECRVMLAVIGREWLDARTADGQRRLDEPYDFVRLEIAAALARPDVLLVPVLVEGAAMPPAAALPEAIRPLARRHAVSVRDETWDADIERLAAIIADAAGPSPATTLVRHWPRTLPWLGAAAVVGALAVIALRGAGALGPSNPPANSTSPPADSGPAATGSPYTIDVPPVAEAAFQHLTYTLVSGNVVRRAGGGELRLRIRLSNNGGTPTNFWDNSFRLAIGGEVLAPTSGLNIVMDAHALGYGVVTFALPAAAAQGTLQLRQPTGVAEIPLDLAPTGRPPVDEGAAIPDSRSQALVKSVISQPELLLDSGGMSVTLERASRRQFVNAVRLRVALRIRNRGGTPRFSGDLTIRAVTDSDSVAPWDFAAEAIPAAASVSSDAVFDLPATATSVLLRSALGEVTDERPIDLR